MNIASYLSRIEIKKVKEPSLDFLLELQNRHLLSIPFEDLDIPDRRRIELDLNKIYNKIIPTNRGGFCYELNGLFHWLLTSLGFKVDLLSAGVFSPLKNEFGPEYDHLVLLVHLNKDYLTDVGFGDSFRKPIEIPNGEVSDISGNYKLMKSNENIFELQREENQIWEPQYHFSLKSKKFDDFKEMCEFQQDSPQSHFRTRMLCTIATETGRITLSNNSLTITEDGTRSKIDFKTEKDFYFLLKKHFEIEL